MGKMQDSYDMDGYGYFRIHIASSLTIFCTPPVSKSIAFPRKNRIFVMG